MRRPSRVLLASAVLALPALLRAQGGQTPTPFVPPGRPAPGSGPRVAPPDPCADLRNRPLITLTLAPAEIFPDDRVTLSWDVRDTRPGIAWSQPVHVHRTFRIGDVIPDPAPSRGTVSWIAPRSIHSGTFTVSTLCGQKAVTYTLEQTPRIDRVTPERGTLGQTIAIHGDHFGVRHVPKPPSEVRFTIDGGMFLLDIKTWTNQRVEVTLSRLPAGNGQIRISKAGRLLSAPIPFHSLGYPQVDIHPVSLPTPRTFPRSISPPVR